MAENLELRKQVAESIGWTKLRILCPGGLYGVPPAGGPEQMPAAYELSTDACFQDVVPWLNQRGWAVAIEQTTQTGRGPTLGPGSYPGVVNLRYMSILNATAKITNRRFERPEQARNQIVGPLADIPATAICEGLVKLAKQEGWNG